MSTRLRLAARSRRAWVMLMFGVVFVCIGFSYWGLQSQVTASPVAAQSYRAHLALLSLNGWAVVFIVCGTVAVVAAVTMWHSLGFTVLMAVSSWWGAEFVASWFLTHYGRALIGALTWLLLVGVLGVTAGWDDPLPRRR